MTTDNFITPPNHVNFKAKKLFGNIGQIIDGSTAYLNINGGGPVEPHTHQHNHLFIVVEGEAKLLIGNNTVILKPDECYLVNGNIPHALWNNIEQTTRVIGISVK